MSNASDVLDGAPVPHERSAAARRLSWVQGLALSGRLLLRDWRAGELRVLSIALVVAVASLTTVAFFADRVRSALNVEANQLLGADLMIFSDRPLDPGMRQQAEALGLQTVELVRFPSMTGNGDQSVLTEIKAVGPGYPLKGRLSIRTLAGGAAAPPRDIPPPGTVWVDDRLLARLKLSIGENLQVGASSLRIGAQVVEDPETSVGFLNLGPRLTMNHADLGSTGLVATGSRVSYRLGVAGAPQAVARFRERAEASVGPGQRVEDVRDARPEINAALERAEKFLGLSALLSVVLAAVAVALAARRYLRRHLDGVAVMRCLGATQPLILRLHVQQFVVLGVVASLLGCVLGLGGQAVLAALLAPLVGVTLPAPGFQPALQGFAAGFVLLLGFALPPIFALRRVPTLRVLRRDLGLPDTAGWLGYVAGVAALAGLILWEAQDPKTGWYVLTGALATMLVLGLATLGLLAVLARIGRHAPFAWRFGLANLRRRRFGTVTQSVALGIGMLALILLTLVRSDLLSSWRQTLPADAPNRFLVNIQPDQAADIRAFFAEQGYPEPTLHPMIRGRLVAINDTAVSSANFTEDRAKRLVDREFNLSWAERAQVDNVMVAGRWWSAQGHGEPQFSVEEGIAQALGIGIGDRLRYDIAGTTFEAPVTSLRRVQWDSFRVNFFVVAPPGVLEPYPATYVTSFHLSAERGAMMDRLVERFPNLLVIDVASVMAQVQRIMDQLVKAVEFVFLFGLLAGLVVLFAAISATHDERVFDAAVLRTVGATGRQMLAAQAAEFVVIGALAGLLASIGASVLGYAIATRIIGVPYVIDPWVWAVGLLGGIAGVTAAGLLGTRRILRTPAMEIFRSVA